MYFCTDSAVPAHKNVPSLASSRILNNSSEDIGSPDGLAWIMSCKPWKIHEKIYWKEKIINRRDKALWQSIDDASVPIG